MQSLAHGGNYHDWSQLPPPFPQPSSISPEFHGQSQTLGGVSMTSSDSSQPDSSWGFPQSEQRLGYIEEQPGPWDTRSNQRSAPPRPNIANTNPQSPIDPDLMVPNAVNVWMQVHTAGYAARCAAAKEAGEDIPTWNEYLTAQLVTGTQTTLTNQKPPVRAKSKKDSKGGKSALDTPTGPSKPSYLTLYPDCFVDKRVVPPVPVDYVPVNSADNIPEVVRRAPNPAHLDWDYLGTLSEAKSLAIRMGCHPDDHQEVCYRRKHIYHQCFNEKLPLRTSFRTIPRNLVCSVSRHVAKVAGPKYGFDRDLIEDIMQSLCKNAVKNDNARNKSVAGGHSHSSSVRNDPDNSDDGEDKDATPRPPKLQKKRKSSEFVEIADDSQTPTPKPKHKKTKPGKALSTSIPQSSSPPPSSPPRRTRPTALNNQTMTPPETISIGFPTPIITLSGNGIPPLGQPPLGQPSLGQPLAGPPIAGPTRFYFPGRKPSETQAVAPQPTDPHPLNSSVQPNSQSSHIALQPPPPIAGSQSPASLPGNAHDLQPFRITIIPGGANYTIDPSQDWEEFIFFISRRISLSPHQTIQYQASETSWVHLNGPESFSQLRAFVALFGNHVNLRISDYNSTPPQISFSNNPPAPTLTAPVVLAPNRSRSHTPFFPASPLDSPLSPASDSTIIPNFHRQQEDLEPPFPQFHNADESRTSVRQESLINSQSQTIQSESQTDYLSSPPHQESLSTDCSQTNMPLPSTLTPTTAKRGPGRPRKDPHAPPKNKPLPKTATTSSNTSSQSTRTRRASAKLAETKEIEEELIAAKAQTHACQTAAQNLRNQQDQENVQRF